MTRRIVGITTGWRLRAAHARCFVLGAWLCALLGPASAATFVVTTTTDSNDGACTVSLCSLRDAVIASNATPGSNIITLPAGTYTLTIPGRKEVAAATGDLNITSNGLTINGAGAATTIVDGGGIDRVFDVHSAPVIFNGITIRNGLPASGDPGGGISNDGTLTLNNCVVTANQTTAGGGGAGIYTNNTLTLNSTSVTGNSAGGGGDGGGIRNDDQVTINSSTISGNAAGPAGGNGAGIVNNGSLLINDSTISGNTGAGGGDGAGLYENSNGNAINRSTFSGNTTNGDGGGIFVNGQPLTLTNVTISGNTAVSGGGIFNNGNGTHLIASTIANNTGGGIANNGAADATGTIIANNGTNCSSPITDSGTNLQFPGATCSGSIPTADPLLQPLGNNGGPTQTHAIPSNSPAVDTNTESCPPPATDQRGISRPQGPHCDIGAFELQVGGGQPTLSINNVSANEGNSGTTPFTFTVTLSAVSASTVTVSYATADGSATAGSDYTAASGVLTFVPGVTSQTITVSVIGDTTPEPNETFTVNLSGATNATIAVAQGVGTIVNDDAAPPTPNLVIPTLNQWGLILLVLLVATIAGVAVRRRR